MWQLVVVGHGVHRGKQRASAHAADATGDHHVGRRGWSGSSFCARARRIVESLKSKLATLRNLRQRTPEAFKSEMLTNQQSAYRRPSRRRRLRSSLTWPWSSTPSSPSSTRLRRPRVEPARCRARCRVPAAEPRPEGPHDHLQAWAEANCELGGSREGPLVSFAAPLRGRLMVGRLTLDQVVGVRVPAPQPRNQADPDLQVTSSERSQTRAELEVPWIRPRHHGPHPRHYVAVMAVVLVVAAWLLVSTFPGPDPESEVPI